ncbi:MAG: prepilin-type N-terminal cleavage/methylation domain-containing protein [Campylobacterota bacterium]|nr:prepilin-type N-terminal cleavage/methylation domain-containing protein [Campylobacterota bacterium]
MYIKNNKNAFSLIELIFVIAILAIIAAVAVPKFLDSRVDALASSIKQDISTVTTAVQSYNMLEGSIFKITDAVNINEDTWKVSDKKIEFFESEKLCITIELLESKLKVTILENSGDICEEIYNEGVRSEEYELF